MSERNDKPVNPKLPDWADEKKFQEFLDRYDFITPESKKASLEKFRQEVEELQKPREYREEALEEQAGDAADEDIEDSGVRTVGHYREEQAKDSPPKITLRGENDFIPAAERLMEEGRLSEAAKMLKSAIEKMPPNWTPLRIKDDKKMGKSVTGFFWSQKEFLSFSQSRPEAYADMSVFWTHPSYSKAYYLLAVIAVESGDYREAIEALDKGLALEPDHPALLCEKGYVLSKMGRHEEAAALYEQAATVRPWAPISQRARALRGRGVVLIDLEQLREAEDILRQALVVSMEADKQTIQDALNDIDDQIAFGELEDAEEMLQKIITYQPSYKLAEGELNYIDNLRNRTSWGAEGSASGSRDGRKLQDSGGAGQSFENLLKTLDLTVEAGEVLNSFGQAYAEERRFEEAIRHYKKATQISPDYYLAFHNLGWAYRGVGDYEQAEESFKRAVEIWPEYAEARYGLGLTYLAHGDKDAALEEYDKLKDVEPKLADWLLGAMRH